MSNNHIRTKITQRISVILSKKLIEACENKKYREVERIKNVLLKCGVLETEYKLETNFVQKNYTIAQKLIKTLRKYNGREFIRTKPVKRTEIREKLEREVLNYHKHFEKHISTMTTAQLKSLINPYS